MPSFPTTNPLFGLLKAISYNADVVDVFIGVKLSPESFVLSNVPSVPLIKPIESEIK
ncbi:hypothetical protein D3C80_1740980 [compost metagenome]